jgi:hypothetical protein
MKTSGFFFALNFPKKKPEVFTFDCETRGHG